MTMYSEDKTWILRQGVMVSLTSKHAWVQCHEYGATIGIIPWLAAVTHGMVQIGF